MESKIKSGWSEDYRIVSVVSGLLAAFCGLVGKLGLDFKSSPITDLDNKHLEYILRVVLVILTLLLNSTMITLYTKALSLASVAAEASLINTASNLCFTALFSFIIFQETLSYQWMIGSVLVLTGLTLLMTGDQDQDVEETKKNE